MAICNLIGPLNESTKSKREDSNKKLASTIAQLVFFGNHNTRTIAESILAESIPNNQLREFIENEKSSYGIPSNQSPIFGKSKQASSRKKFVHLAQGNGLPKTDYKYRVSPKRISTAISFIQSNFYLKPGASNKCTFDGYKFENLPIFERGGQSIEELNKTYNKVYPIKEERVGEKLFRDIANLLSKRGESKARLSTYYIQFKHYVKVFTNMINRTTHFKYSTPETNKQVKLEAQKLLQEWKSIQAFVMWEYAACHLKVSDIDSCHCCTHALGGTCDHSHNLQSCSKCLECFTFFQGKAKNFLNSIQAKQLQEESEKAELNSMFRALPKLTTALTHYMAH